MPKIPLDIENPQQLQTYLKKKVSGFDPASFKCRTIAGGVSNKTVLVELDADRRWVLKQALAKLRVEADWFSDQSRIHVEAEGIRALSGLVLPGQVPGLVFEDKQQFVLAMLAVPEPHENLKQMFLGPIPTEELVSLAGQAGQLLGDIHDRARHKGPRLGKRFADRKFFESLRIQPYFVAAAQKNPAVESFLRNLIADTRQRSLTLTHGDYSPKNMLVRNGRITLLDHEVIHWGDPAFDVGFFLAHLVAKAQHRPDRRADFFAAAAEFISQYAKHAVVVNKICLIPRLAGRDVLGLLLARVDGKSPLEYLTSDQAGNLRALVTGIILDREYPVADLSLDEIMKMLQEKMK